MNTPFLPRARVAKLLDEHACGLKAGQPVNTGAFCISAVTKGYYLARFLNIGDVAFSFSQDGLRRGGLPLSMNVDECLE